MNLSVKHCSCFVFKPFGSQDAQHSFRGLLRNDTDHAAGADVERKDAAGPAACGGFRGPYALPALCGSAGAAHGPLFCCVRFVGFFCCVFQRGMYFKHKKTPCHTRVKKGYFYYFANYIVESCFCDEFLRQDAR